LELKGQKVLVVGLARTGVATARFLLAQQASVCATDLRPVDVFGETADLLLEDGCRLSLGGHERKDFLEADLIVVSPGVPLTIEPLQASRKAGIEVIGEIELASRFIDFPVVGITGTNGKTTTVSLIHTMLEKAGIPHWLGGNIGRPLIECLSAFLEGRANEKPEVAVVELSSFQLETIVSFCPKIAAWTNLTPDHLDRYKDMDDYAEAKARIFMNQGERDYALIPAEDQWLQARRKRIKARPVRFCIGTEADVEIRYEKERIYFQHGRLVEGAGVQEIYETAEVQLPGLHNIENIMVALSAARLCGASPEAIRETMATFRGLPHRIEYVGEKKGVNFYNDSKATTVASVVKALGSFTRPVLLLAGGKGKGTSFRELRKPIREHVKKLFLYGQAAPRMADDLNGAVAIEKAGDLAEALQGAWKHSQPGDVILLSPACASFDMFRDYEDRGEHYKGLVEKIICPGE